MYIRALQGKEKALGPDHLSTLGTANNLGIPYTGQGRLAEAEKMYIRAPAGYERASQSEAIPALNTIYNITLLYRN